MSLRARLLLSLAVMLTVALVAAGILLVGLTRASLVDRVDRDLLALNGPGSQLQRLGNLAAPDNDAGRRLAVLRLDRQGKVVRSYPSGFSDSPDPLPVLPVYASGIPTSAYGVIDERPSTDGSLHYRVLTQRVGRNITLAIAAPLAGVDAAIGTLIRTLLITGSLALIGLLVVAWIVVRHDLLPLERIAKTAESITGGDLTHRAGVTHDNTEVGRLGTAFDAMLDQIEASFGEQQAALDAKAASEERLRRFVADASHELRTPLTAVRGYADLYRAGGLSDPDELATAMSRIGTESRRMGALVDDLLLLARLDQGRPVRRDPVDLSRIADEAVADARALESGTADRRRDRARGGRGGRRGPAAPGRGQPARQRPGPHAGGQPDRGRRSIRRRGGRAARDRPRPRHRRGRRVERVRPLLPRRSGSLARQRRHRARPVHRGFARDGA